MRIKTVAIALIINGLVLVMNGLMQEITTSRACWEPDECIMPISTAYVTWSPDGQYIAVVSDTVDIIHAVTGDVKHHFDAEQFVPSAAVWSPDGMYIGFKRFNEMFAFEVWSDPLGVPTLDAEFELYVGSVAAAWQPQGSVIAIADGPRTNIWDVKTGILLSSFMNGYNSSSTSRLIWSADGETLTIAQGDIVKIVDVKNETVKAIIFLQVYLTPTEDFINPYAIIDWSPSHDRIAVASNFVRIYEEDDIFEYNVIDESYILGGTGWPIHSVSWHPSGNYLASGDSKGKIMIMDTQTRKTIYTLEFADNIHVTSVAWSPDGSTLAYGLPTGENKAGFLLLDDILSAATTEGGH